MVVLVPGGDESPLHWWTVEAVQRGWRAHGSVAASVAASAPRSGGRCLVWRCSARASSEGT